MKHGIAISTYFPKNYREDRLKIFTKSITSLLQSEFPGKIFIVDDGSDVVDHIDIVKAEDYDKRIKIIMKPQNTGIAKTKNTCIKTLLDHGCPIGFLADDDMEYRKGWESLYIDSMKKAKIPHFSFFTGGEVETVEHNGHRINKTPLLCGSLLTFTKNLIDRVGYFKVLPYKYGHEHTNFTTRSILMKEIPFFCDVVDSDKFLNIIPESFSVKSMLEVDQNGVDENGSIALKEFSKEPFID
jgi:glycosyltransferase involved in cell wall biosynthesis